MADQTHETKIVISGDSADAVKHLGMVVASLGKVRAAIGRVFQALGIFGMAWQGVQIGIELLGKLNEWAHRAAKAAAQIRIDAAFNAAATALDGLIRKQSIYNRMLQQELGDLQRRNELSRIEQSGEDDNERIKREVARTNEMAGVTDPRQKMEIEQRWRLEDEQRERSRKEADLKRSAESEDEKSAIYGSKSNALSRAAKEATEEAVALEKAMVGMSKEQKEEARKQIDSLRAKAKASAESAAQYKEEERQADARASLYRKQRDELRDAPSLAQAQNEAERAKFEREQAEKDEKEQQRKSSESSKAANAFVKGYLDDQARERSGRANQLESFAGRMEAADGVSQNRLTAMGLGSGVSASGGVASDVRKLVDLLREEVAATKNIKVGDVSGEAFLGE